MTGPIDSKMPDSTPSLRKTEGPSSTTIRPPNTLNRRELSSLAMKRLQNCEPIELTYILQCIENLALALPPTSKQKDDLLSLANSKQPRGPLTDVQLTISIPKLQNLVVNILKTLEMAQLNDLDQYVDLEIEPFTNIIPLAIIQKQIDAANTLSGPEKDTILSKASKDIMRLGITPRALELALQIKSSPLNMLTLRSVIKSSLSADPSGRIIEDIVTKSREILNMDRRKTFLERSLQILQTFYPHHPNKKQLTDEIRTLPINKKRKRDL